MSYCVTLHDTDVIVCDTMGDTDVVLCDIA